MALLIRHPLSREPERRYALDVVLREFLGLEYQTLAESRANTCISSGDERDGRHLIVPESLFSCPDNRWLTAESLPEPRLRRWSVPRELLDGSERLGDELPVLFNEREPSSLASNGEDLELPIDVFAGVFFLLTRYEELVATE